MATKKTPIDQLTQHVLVLLPAVIAQGPKGMLVKDKVRLAYEAAAELTSVNRDLLTAWSGDEASSWAVQFWEKHEDIR